MTTKEILTKYRAIYAYISEVLVAESKSHISSEQAIEKIRQFLSKNDINRKQHTQLEQDLEWKTWCVDIWGYKSIEQLETRLESYSITLGLINYFVEWLKEEFRKNENLVNSKEGRFSNIVELSLLQEILDKLKELRLYKEGKNVKIRTKVN